MTRSKAKTHRDNTVADLNISPPGELSPKSVCNDMTDKNKFTEKDETQ
jgi:hypothetical protein